MCLFEQGGRDQQIFSLFFAHCTNSRVMSCMKTYTEQDLREKAAVSESMPDLLRALGYGRSANTVKKLKREMTNYGIDYSH